MDRLLFSVDAPKSRISGHLTSVCLHEEFSNKIAVSFLTKLFYAVDVVHNIINTVKNVVKKQYI